MKDRMSGRYLMKCKGARCNWPTAPGASCSGKCHWGRGHTTRWRRKLEKRWWRRLLSKGEYS